MIGEYKGKNIRNKCDEDFERLTHKVDKATNQKLGNAFNYMITQYNTALKTQMKFHTLGNVSANISKRSKKTTIKTRFFLGKIDKRKIEDT